jgi:hypothetical protein
MLDFRKGGAMPDTFFDTHDYIMQLMASGIPIHEAEAHAKALGEAMNNELVKKTDLNTFRAEVKGQFNEVKGQFDLLKWMLGFLLAGIAAMVLKIFH